jgi:hypothetical protein
MLQSWTTVRGTNAATVIQDEADWVDLNGFADAGLWLDVSSFAVGQTVTLSIETSATHDESGFRAAMQPTVLTVTSTPLLLKTARTPTLGPMARWMRWKITGTGAWDATFRIRGAAGRSSFWQPTQLTGCSLWLRADLGVSLSAGSVTAWADQSGVDNTKNLSATGSPTLVNSDAKYAGNPTITLSGTGQYFTSGIWAASVSQPMTWVLVGHRSGGAASQYFMDGNSAGFGLSVFGDNTNAITASAGVNLTSGTGNPWTSPSALMVEDNGVASTLSLNGVQLVSGNAGAVGFNSMTLGAHSIFFGGGNLWAGTIAEVIMFNKLLATNEKSQLRRYLNGRYGSTVG